MRKILGAGSLALVCAAGATQLVPAAQGNKMPVTVRDLPGAVSFSMIINGGKIGTSTTTATPNNDTVTFDVDVGNVGKDEAIPVDVYIGECPNRQVRIWLIEQGQSFPDKDCNHRKIGVIFWGRTARVVIQYPDKLVAGMSTATKVLIAGAIGGGLAAVFGATALGDNNSKPSDTTTGTGTTSSTTTTTTTIPQTSGSATNFQGRYVGTGTRTVNGCAGFSESTAISAQLTVTDNNNATITWAKTHTNAGVTFTFTGVHLVVTSATQASFNATGPGVVGGTNYTVNDSATINGATMTLTQTFTRADGCTVVYQMTLIRQ